MTTMASIGSSTKRIEDPKFLTGRGRYVADINLPGMLHLVLVRSEHAHAHLKKIDVSLAIKQPGVVAAFTGEDLKEQLGSLPAGWVLSNMHEPDHPPIAFDTVRYVGDAVAAIVADDPYVAAEAAGLVDVEYDLLPVEIDAEKATKRGAELVHEDVPRNVAFDWDVHGGDYAAAEKTSDVVVKQRIINQRLIPTAMETRGIVSEYDPGSERLTLYTSTQIPHLVRLLFALVTDIPEHKVRVIAPDVGGAFGSKLYLYAEEIICGIVSKNLGRTVRWIETRKENYLATTHGRDHIADVEICGNRDGTITGIKTHVYANLGAYLSTFAPGIPTVLFGLMLSGVYKIENISCEVTGVFTNTTPVDAYRGAGRPEATFLVERMVDMFANAIGRDPVSVRRKNFIPPFKNGREVATGVKYDSGNYKGALNKALELFDYKGFRKNQIEARRQGKLLGVGFSTYIEICGMAPSAVAAALGAGAGLWESSTVRVHPTGKITVYAGTSPHGQGHVTTFTQIISEKLGVPMEDVEIIHGDTDMHQFGTGTFGSRSLAVGGQALLMSLSKVMEKATKIAAYEMSVDPNKVTYEDGNFRVEDIPDREMPFGDVALAAYSAKNLPPGLEPGLEAVSFFDPENFTWPFGAHIAVVEIDHGVTSLSDYIAVDDIGNVVNPMIVDGMVHGGIAQGIGQALLEGAVYSDDGQLTTSSMSEYAVPKAENFPNFTTARTVTPSPVNDLGVKGAGEAGTIAASPAVVNAVVDALKHLGITHLDMPLQPERVWRAITDAKEALSAKRSDRVKRGK